jgi:hypothetical protein
MVEETAAGMGQYGGSAALHQHGSADKALRSLPQPRRLGAYDDRQIDAVAAGPARGIGNLWAEASGRWLGRMRPV